METAEIDKLVKRQKTFHKSAKDSLDKIVQQIQNAKTIISKDAQLMTQSLVATDKKVNEILTDLQNQTKDYYSVMSKYSKTLEKKFSSNLDLASRPDAFQGKECHLHSIIASHLIREGNFDLSQTFCEESHLELPTDLQEKFSEMYKIMMELRMKNLDPALDWARRHRQQLEVRGSDLEFRLHQLRFVTILTGSDGSKDPASLDYSERVLRALNYAKQEFSVFGSAYLKDIQRLMCSVIYAAPKPSYFGSQETKNFRPLSSSPYSDLTSASQWQNIEQQFAKEFCKLLGLSQDPPLYIVSNIGATALPTMIKLKSLMDERRKERPKVEIWSIEDELPVEIPLPKNQIYHSIFACPVSREQTSDKNPPMMLPCGHVISRDSLIRLSKGGKIPSGTQGPLPQSDPVGADVFRGINTSAKLKCPYCPVESTAGQSLRVTF